MAAKKSKKVVTESRKPIELEKVSNMLEVIPGNTDVLTVKFLAAINAQLADIKLLLSKGK